MIPDNSNAWIDYKFGNCVNLLDNINDDFVKLIITSPPYNVGKEYEKNQPLNAYLEQQEYIIKKLRDKLCDNGSICWNTANYIHNKEVFPLDIYFYKIFSGLGFKLRNRIIWHYGHGLHCNLRFSHRYETILWFTKSDKYIFNLDSVRVPSKYPGKKHFKGPKKGQLSGNPLGKNPSDVWEVVINDWETQIWNIPNVKHNHPEKTIHPCQFPVELAERCILALTNEEDCILDPFAGVASSLIAAAKNNRNSIGIEQNSRYYDEGKKRILKLRKGELSFREINKQVHVPK